MRFNHPDYEVLELLGEGGQANVYLARHRTLERRVAVKLMRPGGHVSMARRMLQEARLIASLRHEHLVEVYDAGLQDGDTPYIVMEYIDGKPLSRWALQRTVTVPMALEVARQVASGLSCAHAAGVVHRDVKPLNIMMLDDPADPGAFCAKLLDFGIARPEDSGETSVGVVVGTVGYMAPECFEGGVVPASDVYSLGVILFRLVSGERGLRGTDIRGVLKAQRRQDRSWSRHPDLVALLESMVAPYPEARPADGAAVVAALDALKPWARFTEPPPAETGLSDVLVSVRGRSSARMYWGLGAAAAVSLTGLVAWGMGWSAPGADALAGLRDATVAAISEDGEELSLLAGEVMPVEEAVDEAPPEPSGARPSEAKPRAARAPAPSAAEPSAPNSSAAAPRVPESKDPPPQAPKSEPVPPPVDTRAADPAADSPAPPDPPPPDVAPDDAVPPGEPAPAPTAFPVGRFSGTIQGRPVTLALTGSPERVRAELTMKVGARSETHVLVGRARPNGSGWSLQAAETDGKWSLDGAVVGDRLDGEVAVNGKRRATLQSRKGGG